MLLGISTLVVFLSIGAIGFLFLLISFLVGELFDLAHDLSHGLDAHGGPSIPSSRILGVVVFVLLAIFLGMILFARNYLKVPPNTVAIFRGGRDV